MPFPAYRIKYLLREATGKNLTALAAEWSVSIDELSKCVRHVPDRIYPEIRLLICEAIGYSVNEVFGKHPLTTDLLSEDTEKRHAA